MGDQKGMLPFPLSGRNIIDQDPTLYKKIDSLYHYDEHVSLYSFV